MTVNTSTQNWAAPKGWCLLIESPVAKFASHDPSASMDSCAGPEPEADPDADPDPDPSAALPSGFEAFWLLKR